MIHSFRDQWLQDFYLVDKGSKKISSEIKDRLFRKLQLIDDATCDLRPATCDLRPATWDLDLRSPPSNHFEKLRGRLASKHSIRINKQWRLVFA